MAQDNLQQSDQELQFKKRARRRLVGAIALVLLMIVILPMVLKDRTAQAPKQDVVISIPSQSTEMTAEPPVTAAPIQQAEPTPAPAAETQANGVEPQAEAKSAEPKPVEPKAVTIADTKPVEAKPTPAVPVAPKETAKQDAPKSETANYFVQIGVFSDPDNVKQMQAKLKDKALKSQTDFIDTAKGKKTRLRVGPFSSEKDAKSALDKVEALSLPGKVVGIN